MASHVNWVLLGLILVAATAARAEEKLPWGTDLTKALKQAREEKKLVLVHFYSDTCVPCRTVEQKVFPQPEVVQAISRNYVPVKINADKTPQIAAHYNVRGWPTDVYLTSAGQELHRDVTSQAADQYVALLDQLAIQAGVGAARQAALQEREARFEQPQYPAGNERQPVHERMVQNQYTSNRYAGEESGQQLQTQPAGGAAPGWQQPLPQNGPYGAEGFQPPKSNPNPQPQYSTNPQLTQKANWQDPADITAPQQPIRNQFVRVEQAPPVGLEGYCPVCICPPGPGQDGQWKKGDRRFGAVHRGRTYLFASPAEQGRFLADPDAYSPVLSGADPVLFAESGQLVEGKRGYGIAYRSQMYFFASEESLKRFQANPYQYAVTAHQAMMRSETGTKFR